MNLYAMLETSEMKEATKNLFPFCDDLNILKLK